MKRPTHVGQFLKVSAGPIAFAIHGGLRAGEIWLMIADALGPAVTFRG
jgi:hypothetical protein